MFSERVLDHFQNPRNAGELPGATFTIKVTNPVCGDILQLSVISQNGRIIAARFLCKGCCTAIACASFLTEELSGKSKQHIVLITADAISCGLGNLPPATFHAAQLAADAAKQLLTHLR